MVLNNSKGILKSLVYVLAAAQTLSLLVVGVINIYNYEISAMRYLFSIIVTPIYCWAMYNWISVMVESINES